jgi:hypothetical protein
MSLFGLLWAGSRPSVNNSAGTQSSHHASDQFSTHYDNDHIMSNATPIENYFSFGIGGNSNHNSRRPSMKTSDSSMSSTERRNSLRSDSGDSNSRNNLEERGPRQLSQDSSNTNDMNHDYTSNHALHYNHSKYNNNNSNKTFDLNPNANNLYQQQNYSGFYSAPQPQMYARRRVSSETRRIRCPSPPPPGVDSHIQRNQSRHLNTAGFHELNLGRSEVVGNVEQPGFANAGDVVVNRIDEDMERKASEEMYSRATWRMFNRITRARAAAGGGGGQDASSSSSSSTTSASSTTTTTTEVEEPLAPRRHRHTAPPESKNISNSAYGISHLERQLKNEGYVCEKQNERKKESIQQHPQSTSTTSGYPTISVGGQEALKADIVHSSVDSLFGFDSDDTSTLEDGGYKEGGGGRGGMGSVEDEGIVV